MSRVFRQTGALEAKRVSVPEDAPWLSSFQTEVLGFPSVTHDDQIDALIQAVAYLEKKRIALANIPIVFPISVSGPSKWRDDFDD